jgi:hypothetical protein
MSDEKKLTRIRKPPTLTTLGKRQVISSGRWNDIVIADYIIANGTRSIEISELAKIAYGHNTNDTKTKVRHYLHKIKTLLIDRGHILVVDYEVRRGRRALAVKLFDGQTEGERQRVNTELARMRHRGEISIERYERALILLGMR